MKVINNRSKYQKILEIQEQFRMPHIKNMSCKGEYKDKCGPCIEIGLVNGESLRAKMAKFLTGCLCFSLRVN